LVIDSVIASATVSLPTLACLIFSTSVPAVSATSAIILTRPWKNSLRATKSVSELTSTSTPLVGFTETPIKPPAATRSAFLAALGRAFRAKEINPRLDVAVGLGERGFAIHHARAGPLTQLLDHLCGDVGHRNSSS